VTDTSSPSSPIAAIEPVFVARGLTKTYGEGTTAVHALRGVGLEEPD